MRKHSYAAMEGEKDKYDNYKDLVNDNYYVVPIAHKTHGFMGSRQSQIYETFGFKNH